LVLPQENCLPALQAGLSGLALHFLVPTTFFSKVAHVGTTQNCGLTLR
jgi:hypothetical protein